MDVAYLDIKSGVLILSYFIVGCIKLLLTCKGNYNKKGRRVWICLDYVFVWVLMVGKISLVFCTRKISVLYMLSSVASN